MTGIARQLPTPLSKYFPSCGRANENTRVELINLGSTYAFGNNGNGASDRCALWAFVLAGFEDEAYYNEIGRDPMSTAAENFRELQISLFLGSKSFIKRAYYGKLMNWMYKCLEFKYYKWS